MRLSLQDVFQGKKNMLIALGISVLIFLALEILIFVIFAASSGERSRIEVRDKSGKIVYDVAGTTLSHINFSYFERKYGDLSNYDVQVKTVKTPFPVRAWVSASVGVPTALMLLIAYLVKVYVTLLQGTDPVDRGDYPVIYGRTPMLISWSLFLRSSSVFMVGVIVSALALSFWMVPNFFGEVLLFSTAAVKDSGWLVLGSAIFLAGFASWAVYLRYRLSRRMMDYQYRLEKKRLDQQLQPAHLPSSVTDGALQKQTDP
ncbi:MAG: hypothetical protein GX443_16525 [Deltaproteobacteria bacterium]|nr:hypothetical protein [Deltaproteobacteria bacterium]